MVRRPKHYDCGVLRQRPVRRPSVARRLLKQTLATNGDAPGYAPTRFGKPVDFGKPVAFNLEICATVCTTYIYMSACCLYLTPSGGGKRNPPMVTWASPKKSRSPGWPLGHLGWLPGTSGATLEGCHLRGHVGWQAEPDWLVRLLGPL